MGEGNGNGNGNGNDNNGRSGLLSGPVLFRLVVVLLLLIGITVIGPYFFQKRAEGLSQAWMQQLEGKPPATGKALVFSQSLADAGAKDRLVEQYEEVSRWAAFHKTVMEFFYVRYYVAIAMSALLGFLAALALAFISRNGWANTDPTLVGIFLVLAAGSAFCAGYPALYQQKLNIETNRAKYLQYRDLDRRIRTFAISDKTPENLVEYLTKIDQEIKRHQALPIGLDDAALAAQREAVAEALAEAEGDSGGGDGGVK